ncbi:hypothetical protein K0M31_012579 [Melipona bicolor]|uniref:Uncharacterized protein n=1 Tax=Melipona bicolor TaxID=60889 RepID=A0AA40KH68_9HYME|nr:hypothetical protein K0M31_012579 [Melipona bicolor]
MTEESRELRSKKGGIGVAKSVMARKGGAGSSEICLEKWCKRRVEMEREVEGRTKKVGTPEGENKSEQNEERMAGVEIKKIIQKIGLQQQEIVKQLKDAEKKIGNGKSQE